MIRQDRFDGDDQSSLFSCVAACLRRKLATLLLSRENSSLSPCCHASPCPKQKPMLYLLNHDEVPSFQNAPYHYCALIRKCSIPLLRIVENKQASSPNNGGRFVSHRTASSHFNEKSSTSVGQPRRSIPSIARMPSIPRYCCQEQPRLRSPT